MRSFSTFLTLVMLAIFSAMMASALQYPSGAQFMPFIVVMPVAVLCLMQRLVDWRNPAASAQAAAQPGVPFCGGLALSEVPHEPEPSGRELVRREAVMMSYFLGFVGGLLLFGFWISVPVMLVSFLHIQARLSWAAALAAGLGGTLILYLVFEVVLGIRLHPGFATHSLFNALGF